MAASALGASMDGVGSTGGRAVGARLRIGADLVGDPRRSRDGAAERRPARLHGLARTAFKTLAARLAASRYHVFDLEM